MKKVHGIWLPDDDTHFDDTIRKSPMYKGEGSYQLSTIEAALKRCKTFRRAIDIGAHVGLWSRVLADNFDHVAAFEPMGHLADAFRRNCAEKDNVHLFQLALGASSSSVYMEKDRKNSGSSRVHPDQIRKIGMRFNMAMLDSFHFTDIDFVKIDVEGYELQVILGAEKTIKAYRPVMVISQKAESAERYGAGRWDAVKLLADWGFREVEVISGDHIMIPR
jgi:FkbM family methyltransferase